MTVTAPQAAKSSFDRYSWLPSLGLAAAAVLVALFTLYAPPSRGAVGVFFPFGTTSTTAIALIGAAGGRLVTTTQLDNVVVAYADDGRFLDRIRALGALFVFAGRGLCAPQSDRTPS